MFGTSPPSPSVRWYVFCSFYRRAMRFHHGRHLSALAEHGTWHATPPPCLPEPRFIRAFLVTRTGTATTTVQFWCRFGTRWTSAARTRAPFGAPGIPIPRGLALRRGVHSTTLVDSTTGWSCTCSYTFRRDILGDPHAAFIPTHDRLGSHPLRAEHL